MRTAEDLYQELLSVDESHRIEVKRCLKVDRSVIETICAMANEPGMAGGYLLLGVGKDQKDLFNTGYTVLGIDDPDKIQSDVASQCATMLNRAIRPRVTVETLQGQTVVVVTVSEESSTNKPIFIKSLGLPRGAYRRVGPTDQEGTEDDLIALYAGHSNESFDGSVVADSDMTDIDTAAIDDYRKLRSSANKNAEELSWGDEELLRSLGCCKRVQGNLVPTVAGILLFGTRAALRRCFPMMRVDYIRVNGREWVQDPDHRFSTLEIHIPLIAAIRRATSTIGDELISSFSLPKGSIAREEEPTLPDRVVREAVVNAVMHRSYRIHGPIQIIRYANRLEIRNPGHSIKAEDQLGEPGSETRNPLIAAVLHEVNIAETKGSGIRAMRELMLASNLFPPTLESTRSPDQFVATFLFHHFLTQKDLDWLNDFCSEQISDEEARALILVREVGAIDNSSYRSINRTDTLNASAHLRRLRDLGLLEMRGAGNKTYYVAGGTWARAEAGGDSGNPHQVTPISPPEVVGIPQALARRIREAGAKPRQETLRGLIVDLCKVQAFSAEQIADILGGRNLKELVRSHLTPLRESGRLVFTIPEMHNHPDQKYRSVILQTD